MNERNSLATCYIPHLHTQLHSKNLKKCVFPFSSLFFLPPGDRLHLWQYRCYTVVNGININRLAAIVWLASRSIHTLHRRFNPTDPVQCRSERRRMLSQPRCLWVHRKWNPSWFCSKLDVVVFAIQMAIFQTNPSGFFPFPFSVYIKATAGLCILSLVTDVIATILTGIGLHTKNQNTKYRYYRRAVLIMLVACKFANTHSTAIHSTRMICKCDALKFT